MDAIKNQTAKKRRSSKRIILILAAILVAAGAVIFVFAQHRPITYELQVSGTVTGEGVVSFLGYDINVYKNQASNPCGDCPYQPEHLFKGDNAASVARAVAATVRRDDNLWRVKEVQGTKVILEEKEAGTVKKSDLDALSAPPGITLRDNYDHKCVGTAANAEAPSRRSVTTLEGDRVSVPADPRRIGAIYGPSYESLYVLGQADRIVVCSDVQKEDFSWAATIFPELKRTPCLENVHSSVNVEKLMTYKPDLVFTFARPSETKQLREGGVSAIEGETTRRLSDVPKELKVYAKAAGHGSIKKANAYEEYFNEKVAYVKDRTAGLSAEQRPAVYYAAITLLTTYGGESDIPDLIETAGGTAVTADLKAGNHTQINFEQLAAWNPEYIFLDHGGMNGGKSVETLRREIYADDKYADIAAVKKKQVYLTPTGAFYWDMGLQKILLLLNVAKTIHPDLFRDLDMEKEIQTFYKKFYNYPLTKEQAHQIYTRQNP